MSLCLKLISTDIFIEARTFFYAHPSYNELREKYTDEELVESFVFPTDLSEEEKKNASSELWEHRKKRLQNRSDQDKIYSNLLRLKYEIEDQVMKTYYEADTALLWWKLAQREIEEEIKTNNEHRQIEMNKVKEVIFKRV